MSYHYSFADFEINENLRDYSQYTFLTEFDALHQSSDIEKYFINFSDLTSNSSDYTFNQTSDTSITMTTSRDPTFNFCDQFTKKNNISTTK